MKFTRTGIVLNTENYSNCCAFYGDKLGLTLLYRSGEGADELTVFAFGSSYLMIERGGSARPGGKTKDQCPTKFRFNVPNVEAASRELAAQDIAVRILRHDWGTTAEFLDPDGNRCALRSDRGFGA